MEDPKSQLVQRLQDANNILVSVSRDPSVDQLAACLGLTLLLNKLGKHTAAVFSGTVPSTLEFLKPEETLESNTDSLRDFIIALDKSKADKLRYKVEDEVVRIFITPYKTSISEADLEFSQGDFNVDVVVALGVQRQEDLDEAITAHGRILHDATVTSLNISNEGGLGNINWNDASASSLSEMVTQLSQSLGEGLLDQQIATALLTGIVAETERFSNAKTSAFTMQASATLMGAGADQQLVAEKLQQPAVPPETAESEVPEDEPKDPGTLEINHDTVENDEPELTLPEVTEEAEPEVEQPVEDDANLMGGSRLITEPPKLGSPLTANTLPEALDPTTDPLSMPKAEKPMLSHDVPMSQPGPGSPPTPRPTNDQSDDAADQTAQEEKTLLQLENAVHSPHVADTESAEQPDETDNALSSVRDEVDRAIMAAPSPQPPAPVQALNAQPMAENLNSQPVGLSPLAMMDNASPSDSSASVLDEPTIAEAEQPSGAPAPGPMPTMDNGTSAPPVPPPIPFQFGTPPMPNTQTQQNQQ